MNKETDKTVVMTSENQKKFWTKEDKEKLSTLDEMYRVNLEYSKNIDLNDLKKSESAINSLAEQQKKIGLKLEEFCSEFKNIHVFSFETVPEERTSVSRIVSKLRNVTTEKEEFIYYIQRAYEMVFTHTYCDKSLKKKRFTITKTPVNIPYQNYASHKIPDIDEYINNSVMCVMLRGALLPSIIVSKEIQDYSSKNYITPFALFKISRDDTCNRDNMRYILNLKNSYFNFEDLQGKDLIFADPMNATGGSFVTIINYLKQNGIKPKSIKFLNILSTFSGCLYITRALPEVEIHTLWMDPVMNERAYIMPGLGDAGDRLNGFDEKGQPRNMIQLMADYGLNMAKLYRAQYKKIEETIFG